MRNPNKRIVFRRIFEWSDTTNKVVATWNDNGTDKIEEAYIQASEEFSNWVKRNIKGEWGLKFIDYSIFHVWFFDKEDAKKFLEEYY